METKRCTKCGEVKSLVVFDKSKREKDGHNNWCKQCKKENRKKHKRASRYHPSRRKTQDKKDLERGFCVLIKGVSCKSIFYTCRECAEFKHFSKFGISKKAKSGIMSVCKKCRNDRAQKQRDRLDSHIVAKIMRISVHDCPPELIEAKRAQLKLHRATL